jgi:glutamyl-tRNA synthetase
VRTALYNWLFARKNKGKFILRIEDTDRERSSEEYVSVIQEGLKWIGLDWDEGPFFQSERENIYRAALDELISKDAVYPCYCTPEELAGRREEARKSGKGYGYDGRCRDISPEEIRNKTEQGVLPAYRLKISREGRIGFRDMVKGDIDVDLSTLDDFVIAKRDRSPLYNFACVIDDSALGITHVIRGDDHIYNTHKQILIYEAMEKSIPEFAHLPQVHGKDGKKLSKRTGAVSLDEYREKGYLPAALRNYLALLGWSTEDSQQIFSEEDLLSSFDLERCSSSSAIFDTDKLDWMNGKYIRELSPQTIAELVSGDLEDSGIPVEKYGQRLFDAIELEKEKISFLTDLPGLVYYLLKDDFEYDQKAVKKRLETEDAGDILRDMLELLSGLDVFSHDTLEDAMRRYCEEKSCKAGAVFHPLRVAVSGRMKGPGVFALLEFLGKEEVIRRIEKTIKEKIQDE